MAIERLLEGEAEEITKAVIAAACAGEGVAMKLVMERIAPLRRGRPVQFDLPELHVANDVSAALNGILRATAAGELTPDEAATLAGILEGKRRSLETVEMEARISAIEAANKRTGR